MDQVGALAKLLQSYGAYGGLSLAIVVIVFQQRSIRQLEREKLELAMQVIPLLDPLQKMLDRAIRANRKRREKKKPETAKP